MQCLGEVCTSIHGVEIGEAEQLTQKTLFGALVHLFGLFLLVLDVAQEFGEVLINIHLDVVVRLEHAIEAMYHDVVDIVNESTCGYV